MEFQQMLFQGCRSNRDSASSHSSASKEGGPTDVPGRSNLHCNSLEVKSVRLTVAGQFFGVDSEIPTLAWQALGFDSARSTLVLQLWGS